MSGTPEQPRIACTWCGLFSTPGFCDSCGSPLPTLDPSVPASDPAPSPLQATSSPIASVASPGPADEAPFSEQAAELVEPVPQELLMADESFAFVEDPAPQLAAAIDPEPPDPIESLDSRSDLPNPVDPSSAGSSPATVEAVVTAPEEGTAGMSTRTQSPDEEPATGIAPDAPPAPVDEEPAASEPQPPTRSNDGAEAGASQGPRCPSCGRPGRGGLCEACREAIRELSGLSR